MQSWATVVVRLINVPNKDCAVSAIHEHFDPVLDMGRSIDSSIFVMCHVTFYATDFLKHIGHVFDRRHLSSCLPLLSRRVNKPVVVIRSWRTNVRIW